ncbi:MAG: class I SAM-dependent methyltransferase [Chloroflexota bacterium]
MNLDQVSFLQQADISSLINDLDITEHNHLQVATRLRKSWSADQAHAILETAILRQKAKTKFKKADEMLFTRAALEQASGEQISSYRKGRYAERRFETVADLCCGIGGDSLAFATQFIVKGVDYDPVRLAMASHNLTMYGRDRDFQTVIGDLTQLEPIAEADAFFFDPGRRTAEGKRIYSLKHYHPSISILDRWLPIVPHGGVKISPGIDYAELPSADIASVEFVSVDGHVREAILWYGDLKDYAHRRATILPSGATLSVQSDLPKVALSPPKRWLYEPDGAIIRAHLVGELAHLLGCYQIDPSIAYLTADSLHETPFARAFEVIDYFPFQLKKLRKYLREHRVGRIVVKKRGSPIEPIWLQKQLKLKGDRSVTLFLTQMSGSPIVIVGN